MLNEDQINIFWSLKLIGLGIAEIYEVEKCNFLAIIIIERSEKLSENCQKPIVTSLLTTSKPSRFEVGSSSFPTITQAQAPRLFSIRKQ